MVSTYFDLKMGLNLGPFWTQIKPHFGPKIDVILDQIRAHF